MKDLTKINVNHQTIKQRVIHQATRDPVTLTSAGVGAVLLAGGALLGVGWGAAVAGAVLIPTGFLFNYQFRHSEFQKRFMDDVAQALERKRQRRLGEIRADLYDLASSLPNKDEAGDLAAQALEQFGQIHQKFDQFLEVLDRKLHPGELAHARYLGTADQLLMKIIEHLSRSGDLLQQNQVDQVRNLIKQNAEAIEAFDGACQKLVQLKDLDSSQSSDIEMISIQLDELARQAERLGEIS